MESFDNAFKKYFSFVDNEYVSAVLTLLLILYAGVVAPKLPEKIVFLFDYTIVKLAIFFLIVYLFRKNPSVALIASIAVFVTLTVLNSYKFNKETMEVIGMEEELFKRPHYNNPECDHVGEGVIGAPPAPHVTEINGVMIDGVIGSNPAKEYAPAIPASEQMETQEKVDTDEKKIAEEEQINKAMNKIDELKHKLGRELTLEEMQDVCAEVSKDSRFGTFSVDNLDLLQCSGRNTNTAVIGNDYVKRLAPAI